jgi:hypothetical protein
MHTIRRLLAFVVVTASLITSPQQTVSAAPVPQKGVTGGVNILSTQPMRICVGDTISFEGAASVDFPPITDENGQELPLAPLVFISLKIKAQNGLVSPDTVWHPGDFTYFTFTYKATKPGTDTLTLVLNDGAATYQEPVRVQEKCDYDAFLSEVIHFKTTQSGEPFESITTVTGMGTMKRDREGTEFLQGEGTWHLEETILSKPADCVQYYIPPLVTSGPFDLDAKVDDESNLLDVILSMKPNLDQAVYHGKSYCIDADGNRGEGWSYGMGGDESKASKIETEMPLGGGSKPVEMKGTGMQIVESMGDLDYTATLTLIPR